MYAILPYMLHLPRSCVAGMWLYKLLSISKCRQFKGLSAVLSSTPDGDCLQYIDLYPDPDRVSCASAYGYRTANYVERTPTWHHLAVTWTKEHGVTKIYKDGLLMAEVDSQPGFCAITCSISPQETFEASSSLKSHTYTAELTHCLCL